ncbi:MAG: hypothetical protein V1743_07880 [Nanoarchaeota archaeon]
MNSARKCGIMLVVVLLSIQLVSALNTFVSLEITSLRDKSNTEIALSIPFDVTEPLGENTFDNNGWKYCIDTTCIPILSMLKQGWSQTQGPFVETAGAWYPGSTHTAKIIIEGDNSDMFSDLRMFEQDGITPRRWQTDRIRFLVSPNCPLMNPGGSDLDGAMNSNYFAMASGDPNRGGYGDVDDCAGGRIEWSFDFTV